MDLEVGMYVRTFDGYISNVNNIKDKKIYNNHFLKIGIIKKASHNIIDLIEVGDYVNGLRVHGITDFGLEVYMFGDCKEILEENEIKTILTKEQFESMSYKIS